MVARVLVKKISDNPKRTRTSRHLASDRNSDGLRRVPIGTFRDPTFVSRLSWRMDLEKVEYDIRQVCEELAVQDVDCFCDNSIFDDDAPAQLWSALFEGRAAARITPRILAELKPWADRRPNHPVNAALSAESDGLEVVSARDWTEPEQRSFIHYTNILGVRKRMLHWAEIAFANEFGRPPREGDKSTIHGIAQRAVGERGFLLAKKGAGEQAAGALSFADEELVYTAVASALRTGRQTTILTKDEDLLEQFYRLIYLLDTHYRSMLVAQLYKHHFSTFRSHPMPRSGQWSDFFQGENNILVERDGDLQDRVLAPSFKFVAVSCVLLGGRLQQMTFGAETEMQNLIVMKGRTRGRNTDLLGARNCHFYLAGLPAPSKDMPACFTVAEDRCHNVAEQLIPHIEMNHGVMLVERFRRIVESPLFVPRFP